MKTLSINFVSNFDKMGDNRFVMIQRNNDVALYRREDMEGHVIGYEVFKIKIVLEGAALPGGNKIEESYEKYPGAKSFGKVAYFTPNLNRAKELYQELTNEVLLGKKTKNKEINIPNGNFTMKMLIELTKSNQAHLYPIVKKWEENHLIKVVLLEKPKNGRGRSAKVYRKV